MNEVMTVYKLIILYTLNQTSVPLTFNLISDFIIGHGYTNYFNAQNAFSELMDAGLITRSRTTYNTSYYAITATGQETLELFYTSLSHEIRLEINLYLEENHSLIIDRTSITSDYRRHENGDYITHCSILENGEPIFELTLSVPSEKDAIKLCNNWRNNSSELYATAVRTLLE